MVIHSSFEYISKTIPLSSPFFNRNSSFDLSQSHYYLLFSPIVCQLFYLSYQCSCRTSKVSGHQPLLWKLDNYQYKYNHDILRAQYFLYTNPYFYITIYIQDQVPNNQTVDILVSRICTNYKDRNYTSRQEKSLKIILLIFSIFQ